MKINHYTVLAIVSILLTIAGLSGLSYTIKEGLNFIIWMNPFDS